MTYKPCCPKITYPEQRADYGVLSPSAFHAVSRTWAGYNSYWNGSQWLTGNFGIDIDTGGKVYQTNFQTSSPPQASSPFTFGPIARDHDGTHYFLISRSQATVNPWQNAVEGDLPDPLDGNETGVYTFELVSVPATGWSGMTASIELVHDEGFVYSQSGVSARTTRNDFVVEGLDWSPFEDCLYATITHRDSGHTIVSTQNYPNNGYDHAAANLELWRIEFDGTHSVVWDLSTPNGSNSCSPVAVAADGSVWFMTSSSPDSVGGTYTTQVWRLAEGVVSEVVLEGGPYAHQFSALGTTPWGDVLIPHQVGTYPSVSQELIMVSPDGSTIPYECDDLNGNNQIVGMMRQEDYKKLYVFTTYGGGAQRLMEIDWKRCGSGWRVGGM